MTWLIYIILAVIAALPVILIKIFVSKHIFTSFSIGLLIIKLVTIYTFVTTGYLYFISNDISIAIFYPIIKCIEILIPIIFSVVVYKTKLNIINYIGIFFALMAIVCIHWN